MDTIAWGVSGCTWGVERFWNNIPLPLLLHLLDVCVLVVVAAGLFQPTGLYAICSLLGFHVRFLFCTALGQNTSPTMVVMTRFPLRPQPQLRVLLPGFKTE